MYEHLDPLCEQRVQKCSSRWGESNGNKFDKISQRDDAGLTKNSGNEKSAMIFMSLDSSRRAESIDTHIDVF